MRDLLTQMQNHIEFLGYEITDNNNNSFIAENNNRFFVVKDLTYGILHVSYWPLNNIDSKLYEIINRANEIANVSVYIVSTDNEKQTLAIEAFYCGEYSKVSYGRFLDLFHKDCAEKLFYNEELKQYMN